MNRAIRKRAAKLKEKALSRLLQTKGSDLQAVSNRSSLEQYSQTLALFETSKRSPVEVARDLTTSLFEATEHLCQNDVANFVTPEKLQKIDCCQGCSWCCYQPLQVSIPSAIGVALHLIDSGKESDFVPQIERFVETIAPLQNDHRRLKESFEPCPFLGSTGLCQVYQARPIVCRAFHSTDVKTCRTIVEQRHSVREVPMFPPLFGFIGIPMSGARQALKDLGLDDRPVVLASAVGLLLRDVHGVLELWLQGEKVFDPVAVRS